MVAASLVQVKVMIPTAAACIAITTSYVKNRQGHGHLEGLAFLLQSGDQFVTPERGRKWSGKQELMRLCFGSLVILFRKLRLKVLDEKLFELIFNIDVDLSLLFDRLYLLWNSCFFYALRSNNHSVTKKLLGALS